jgi:putative oxidoreductase
MATTTYPHLRRHTPIGHSAAVRTLHRLLPLFGRVLFVLMFLTSVPHHFDSQGVAYAAQHGVPLPHVLVPLSGVLLLLGGASIGLGFHARIGAVLLALFLIPVTFFMHRFWDIADTAAAQMQYVQFMKNVSLLGATLLIAYFGSGPASIDSERSVR